MVNKTNLTIKLVILLFLINFVAPAAAGKIIYVDADAIGANDGSSWVDAYNYLQDALADASVSEKPVEICVAQGNYKPDQGANQTPGDREATFQLINGVVINGGYAGFGEPDPNAKDVMLYETILSGRQRIIDSIALVAEDAAKRVLVPTGPVSDDWKLSHAFDDSVWISGTGGVGYERGSGYEEFISIDVTAQMYTQNPTCFIRIPFTVNANDLSESNFMTLNIRYDDGFIAYINGLEVQRAFFSGTPAWNSAASGNHEAGGVESFDISKHISAIRPGQNILAIHGMNVSPTSSDFLISVEIVAGLAEDYVQEIDIGGLLTDPKQAENSYHVVTGSGTDANAVLDGFTITAGNANGDTEQQKSGAGMFNRSGSPRVLNCTFTLNMAEVYGGGMCNIYNSSPTLINCVFIRNSATGPDPYICYGGGMFNTGNSSPIVINCTFSGNSSDYAGGGVRNGDLYRGPANPILMNCMFSGNIAKAGGGINNYKSSPTLTNCIFTGNSAIGVTPPVYWDGYGGGMSNWDSCNPNLINCTFSKNFASGYVTLGGAIFDINNCNPTLTNCILWGDTPDEIYDYVGQSYVDSTARVTYSDVEGGWGGTGNINRNPLFVSGPLGDYYLSQRKAGQTSDSPCVDTGSGTANNLGMTELTTRSDEVFDQGIVDMGYHYPKSTPADSGNDRNLEGF
jgi:hypothetical protein